LEGEITTTMTSTKYHVCQTCRGEGKVVNPAVSVWTADDRYDDPEGFESMMRGDYDVTCPECFGKRVVTRSEAAAFAERERDRRTMFMESGVYPGSRDWY